MGWVGAARDRARSAGVYATRAAVAFRPRLSLSPLGQPARGPGNGLPPSHRKERTQRMNLTAFVALVRRDLRLFFMDQRAVTMSFAAPIVIASFFGYLFAPVSSGSGAASKIKVAAVNLDE